MSWTFVGEAVIWERITGLPVAHGETYRIFHHMASQVYPGDDVKKGTA
jgi:hypothetical protein